MKEIYKPPNWHEPRSILSPGANSPEEIISQFRSHLERMSGKAYQDLAAKEREPLIDSLLGSGLLDIGLAVHILMQAPQTITELKRIALEYLQVGRAITSARRLIRRKEPMPFLLGDTEPSGGTTSSDTIHKSELVARDPFEIDACDQ